MAEDKGHTAIMRCLRSHCLLSHRRAPAAAAAVSAEERAAAERDADLAATALLAELEAESAGKQQTQKKKASKKSKAIKGAAGAEQTQPSATAECAKAAAHTETAQAAPLSAAAVAAADEALRRAKALAQYEALARALEQHCAQASEAVLAEARALRERLHKKHTKESQKLVGARRAGVRVRGRGCAGVAWAAGSLNALSVRARGRLGWTSDVDGRVRVHGTVLCSGLPEGYFTFLLFFN